MSGTLNRTGQRSESSGSILAPGRSCFWHREPQQRNSQLMTKKENETVEPQASEALPSAKTEAVEISERNKRGSDLLATMQVALSLNTSGFSDEDSIVLRKESVARYREFASADETERSLATLAVGLQNAAMTSLEHAASADMLEARSEELRNATRAARAVSELLEAFDRHRGRGKQSVTVGQVTVETGGQAIVGNVNSEGRRNTPDDMEDPNNDSTP